MWASGVTSHAANHKYDGSDVVSEYAYGVSDVLMHDNPTERSIATATLTKKKECNLGANVPSTIRIKFWMKCATAATNSEGRIYRNGVAVGTLRILNSTSWTAYSEDIAGWSAGDLLQLYCRNQNAAFTVHVKDLQVLGANAVVPVSVLSTADIVNQDP